MAKNKGLKWIVGLSSVAVFTGFVGLSQKYDQTSVATTNAVQTNDNNGFYFNDGSSDENTQFGDSSSGNENNNRYSGGNQFGNHDNSESNQIRGHAS
jgi:hypothetical protein